MSVYKYRQVEMENVMRVSHEAFSEDTKIGDVPELFSMIFYVGRKNST